MPWIGELTSYPRERPRKCGLQSWEKCHGERRREGRGGRVSGLARVGIPEAVGRRVRGGRQAGPLYIPGREPSVSARNKSGETGLAPGRRGLLCRAAGLGCSCAQRLHGGGATRRT